MLETLLLRSGTVSYFLQVLPLGLLAAGIFALVRRWQRKQRRLRTVHAREVTLTLLVCYITGLLALVWTPANLWSYLWFYFLNGYPGTEVGKMFTLDFNFVPSIIPYLRGELTGGAWVQEMLLGNVLMFLPLGLLLPLAERRVTEKNMLPVFLGCALLIEVFQPVFGRSFDMDDLICNTLGGVLGYAVYAVLRTLFPGLVIRCQKGVNA